MPIPQVQEVIDKYKAEEDKIEAILKKQGEEIRSQEEKLMPKTALNVTAEQAVERNKQLLMDLETVKGNLRSKAIFSPYELQWEKICKKYQSDPSLPVTKYRCCSPIYI